MKRKQVPFCWYVHSRDSKNFLADFYLIYRVKNTSALECRHCENFSIRYFICPLINILLTYIQATFNFEKAIVHNILDVLAPLVNLSIADTNKELLGNYPEFIGLLLDIIADDGNSKEYLQRAKQEAAKVCLVVVLIIVS